nr:MAG TPA: hypothetical protein [Caudoviricetes sp.]
MHGDNVHLIYQNPLTDYQSEHIISSWVIT